VTSTRGRVIAVDGPQAQAVVRCEQFDLRVTHPPVAWKPGDHVDVDRGVVVRSFGGGDYPGPGSEVMRMPRPRVDRVHARAKALAKLREVFAARGFLEVETPLVVPSPGLEIHLDAVRAGAGYLITSPEYQMKRLLAAGFERIYQVCKCFRANEEGTQHSSEFTMIEWYRAFAGIDAIVEDTEQLVHAVCGDHARIGARQIDVKPPWRRMTVRDAMREHAGVHVDGAEPAGDLVAEVRRAGIAVADGTAWDDAFFAAFLARVEPAIAALDHALVLGGIELANAFDELTDPVEQRARFLDDQRIRAERGKPVYPLDEKLLAALAEGLPPSAGIALGFDRLVMLATGAEHIRQVLAFTTDEL
jgi:lysyl-tRNA synthetase class 2